MCTSIGWIKYLTNTSNVYHRITKMKPAHVQLGMYIKYGVEHNKKDTKFKVGDRVRIPKYKRHFR